jgi:hypothetical protein
MSILPNLKRSESSKFLELAKSYTEVLAEQKIYLKATAVPDICPIFDALSLDEKRDVIRRMDGDLALFAEVKNEGETLTDSPRLLWRYLVRAHLVPCSDIFDKIEKEDVVSVYDIKNRQIFQNMRFFELVSVTLEQLFCSPWYAYTKRPPEVEQQLYMTATSIMSGQIRTTVAPPAPEHFCQEVNTEGLVKLSIKVKWASPVFSAGNTAAMIVINRCQQVV